MKARIIKNHVRRGLGGLEESLSADNALDAHGLLVLKDISDEQGIEMNLLTLLVWDLAVLLSFALRSRFMLALAPY